MNLFNEGEKVCDLKNPNKMYYAPNWYSLYALDMQYLELQEQVLVQWSSVGRDTNMRV